MTRLAVALALAPFAAKAVVALLWALGDRPPIYVDGDDALLELGVLSAARGEQLVGPYSRYDWSHPGPLYFYLLLPFYEVTGRHALGLHWGAMSINAASVAALLVCARRWGGPPFLVAAVLAVALHVAYFGAARLSHPWNPFVTLLPFGLSLVLAGGVAGGSSRALAALVAVGSFVAQTHVGLAPALLLVGVAALVLGRPHLSTLAIAGLATVLLWLPPLLEWWNLAEVAAFFARGAEPRVGWALGLEALAIYLNGGLAFLAGGMRPIALPWAPGWVMATLAALQAALLVAVLRRDGRLERGMAVVGLVGLASAALAMAQLRGVLHYYLALWVGVLGLVNWATVGAALLGGRMAGAAALVLTAALVVVGVEQVRVAGLPAPGSASAEVAALYAGLPPSPAVLCIAGPEQFQLAAGLMLAAAKDGRALFVEPVWARRFSARFAARGDEPVELLLDAAAGESARRGEGYQVLARAGEVALLRRVD